MLAQKTTKGKRYTVQFTDCAVYQYIGRGVNERERVELERRGRRERWKEMEKRKSDFHQKLLCFVFFCLFFLFQSQLLKRICVRID